MLGNKKKRKRDKNWISAETWSLINKRREINEKKGAARSQRLIEKLSVEYSLANREFRKKYTEGHENGL